MFPPTTRKNPIANNIGHSLVEMLLVLLLLLIFGLTAFSLIFTGSDTYSSLISNKDNSSDARIIISVINTRMRQYDTPGAITLESISWEGKNIPAMAFLENIEDDTLKTWLFWEDNCLWEALTLNDEEPDLALAQSLLINENLEVSFSEDDKRLKVDVSYPFYQQKQTIATSYTPRTSH